MQHIRLLCDIWKIKDLFPSLNVLPLLQSGAGRVLQTSVQASAENDSFCLRTLADRRDLRSPTTRLGFSPQVVYLPPHMESEGGGDWGWGKKRCPTQRSPQRRRVSNISSTVQQLFHGHQNTLCIMNICILNTKTIVFFIKRWIQILHSLIRTKWAILLIFFFQFTATSSFFVAGRTKSAKA